MDLQKMWLYILGLVLICLSRLACQEVQTTTRCLRDGRTDMRLQCPENTYIQVVRALAVKTKSVPDMYWCSTPKFDIMDCTEYEEELTEEFRSDCNRFQHCTRYSPFVNLDQCGSNFQQGIVYQHIEYRCLPLTRHVHEVTSTAMTISGREIDIYTAGYPSAWQTMSSIACNITLPPNVRVQLEVLEFSYNTDNVCPFTMWMNPDKAVCAKKTGLYDILTVGPYDWGGYAQLQFQTMIDQDVSLKVWFRSTATEPDWQANRDQTQITCQEQNNIPTHPVPPPVPDRGTRPGGSHENSQEVSQEVTEPVNGTNNEGSNMHMKKTTDTKAVIAGAVVGTLVIIAVIVILVVVFCVRKRCAKKNNDQGMAYNCHANLNVALAQESGHKGSLGTNFSPLNPQESTPDGSSRGMKPPHLPLVDNQLSLEENMYSDIKSPKTPLSPEYAEIGSPFFRNGNDNTVPKMSPLYDDTALSKARRQFQDSPVDMSPPYATTIASGLVPIYAQPNKANKTKDTTDNTPSPLYSQPNKGFQLLHDVATPNATAVRPHKKKAPVATPEQNSIADLYAQPQKPPKQQIRLSSSDTVIVDNDLYSQ